MNIKAIIILPILSIFSLNLKAQIDQEKVNDFARNYAYQYKIPLTQVEAILANATYQPTIIEKMERPAEGTMTWTRYRNIFMQDDRIEAGVAFWESNAETLETVSAQTGVPTEIILGILGVETFFGQRKGTYKVLDALYTLAFGYPKRSKFFTSELEKFIELCQLEDLDIDEIKGSYAGAIGYPQFMPSSYLAYAKSYDKGGKRDLMNDADDAIASIANYLKVHRWKTDEPIVLPADVSADAKSLEKQSLKPKNNLAFYEKLGYTSALPTSYDGAATLLAMELDNEEKEYWLGLENFYVITRYNHSSLYALVVYQLGEAVKSRKTSR